MILGGCRVGKAPKFVDAFKLVIGGALPVLAPKHYHMFVDLYEKDRSKGSTLYMGTYEVLCYAFEVNSLTPFQGPGTLLKALADNPKNVTIDGNRVLPASLQRRGSGRTSMGSRQVPDAGRRCHSAGRSPIETQLAPGEFRHRKGRDLQDALRQSQPRATSPLAGLKQALSQDVRDAAGLRLPGLGAARA